MTPRELGHSGMMIEQPLNQLQEEVAQLLEEESAELVQSGCALIQASSKLLRCGLSFVPTGDTQSFKQKFSVEVADVLTLIDEAVDAGLIDFDTLTATLDSKPAKLRRFTKHLGYAPVRFANPLLYRLNGHEADRD